MTTAQDVAKQLAQLSDAGLWRGIAPALHVGDAQLAAPAVKPIAFPAGVIDSVRADLVREGYFQLPPQDWGIEVATLAAGVAALDTAGFPPVFLFMYDEAWFMFARLRGLLAAVLGESFRMQPAFWAWHVNGKREGAGWSPHRDMGHKSLLPDRSPKSLTVWLPLTEATPQNGCMYVVPADREIYYGTAREQESPITLQDVRALPSAAGGVLGWTQALFHWGGRARQPVTTPRISISVEFQRGDQPPIFEPQFDPAATLDVVTRLRLIMRQALQYQHMYPLPAEMRTVAEALAYKSGPAQAFVDSMRTP